MYPYLAIEIQLPRRGSTPAVGLGGGSISHGTSVAPSIARANGMLSSSEGYGLGIAYKTFYQLREHGLASAQTHLYLQSSAAGTRGRQL